MKAMQDLDLPQLTRHACTGFCLGAHLSRHPAPPFLSLALLVACRLQQMWCKRPCGTQLQAHPVNKGQLPS